MTQLHDVYINALLANATYAVRAARSSMSMNGLPRPLPLLGRRNG